MAFVDPGHFAVTLYPASGWTELGPTDGTGRRARDFHVCHGQPKRLFGRELVKNARHPNLRAPSGRQPCWFWGHRKFRLPGGPRFR